MWQSAGFNDAHRFRLLLDYFNIEMEDSLGLLASSTEIYEAVFADGVTNCSHPLAHRVTFNGPCTHGAAPSVADIRTDYGNGPGQKVAGADIQLSYGLPFYKGDLRMGLTATRMLTHKHARAEIDGYRLDDGDNRLGDLNYEVAASASPKWRANTHINYSQDIHNFRLIMNFISGVNDERFNRSNYATDQLYEEAFLAYGVYSSYGIKGKDWITTDFHYNVELPWDATFSFSIHNLTDEEPPASRQELGYDPRIGNPLMRTFEVGFQKRF